MYSSEYTSGFSWAAASHLAAPPSTRHEVNVGQAPNRMLKKSASSHGSWCVKREIQLVSHVYFVCVMCLLNETNQMNKTNQITGSTVQPVLPGCPANGRLDRVETRAVSCISPDVMQ